MKIKVYNKDVETGLPEQTCSYSIEGDNLIGTVSGEVTLSEFKQGSVLEIFNGTFLENLGEYCKIGRFIDKGIIESISGVLVSTNLREDLIILTRGKSGEWFFNDCVNPEEPLLEDHFKELEEVSVEYLLFREDS